MTPSDQALLDHWQRNRSLPPADRLRAVNESDGGVEGHARYAEQPSKALGCQTRETSSAPTTEAVAGIKPGPSDQVEVSATTRAMFEASAGIALIAKARRRVVRVGDHDAEFSRVLDAVREVMEAAE